MQNSQDTRVATNCDHVWARIPGRPSRACATWYQPPERPQLRLHLNL